MLITIYGNVSLLNINIIVFALLINYSTDYLETIINQQNFQKRCVYFSQQSKHFLNRTFLQSLLFVNRN